MFMITQMIKKAINTHISFYMIVSCNCIVNGIKSMLTWVPQ